MATVHSYKRFSDPSQSDGDSERRQDDYAAAFCKRHNHKLSKEKFFDKGKSSFRGDKQLALKRFVKAIDDGEVQPGDILLVEAIDRLSRKGIRETQNLINKILDAGIDIAICSPIEKTYKANDKNDFAGAVELAAFAYSAYIYSKMLSSRIKSYNEERRANISKGKKVANNCPNWLTYNREKKEYEVKPQAEATIKFIFERTIKGIGAPNLCRELNQKFPIIGTRKNSKVWNKTYVRELLNSRRILGEFQPTAYDDNGDIQDIGEPIPNYYPAIVDQKTYDAAQAAQAHRKVERGPRVDYVNLWTGLIHHVMDDCPAHIYTYQQRRADGRKVIFRRLKSYAMVNNEPGASPETVGIEDFDNAILSFLHEVDPAELTGQKKPKIDLASKREAIAKKQKRIAELAKLLESEDEDVATVFASIKNLKAQVKILESELKALQATESHYQNNNLLEVKSLVKLAVSAEQRQILSEALKRVIKRVSILPVKLGELRRSPVACLAEIEFFNGSRKRVSFCGKEKIAFDILPSMKIASLTQTSPIELKKIIRQIKAVTHSKQIKNPLPKERRLLGINKKRA